MIKEEVQEPVSVNPFEFLAESMIRKIEEEPLMATLHLTGGRVEVEVPKGHAWYGELRRRRNAQLAQLRAQFK